MNITDIRLQNFRSYLDSSFEIDKYTTIIVGPNAAGKTNLLEAIMLVCSGKTFRNNKRLIKTDQNWARIDVHNDQNQKRTAKIIRDNESQTLGFEIDQKSYSKLTASTQIPVVVFEPNHLFLLHADPKQRRAYLDDIIEQKDSGFGRVRVNYLRSLAQRNRLLKQGVKDRNLLFAWNVRLIEDATKIVSARIKLVKRINEQVSDIYQTISKSKQEIKVLYSGSVNGENYSNDLMKRLDNELQKDLLRGYTHSGPHRDDFLCMIDDEQAQQVCSRGEIRTIILALKVIEVQIIEAKFNQKPVFLLDDVFSELDGARRKALVEFVRDYQTVITTTDADIVTKNFSQKCQIIVLS